MGLHSQTNFEMYNKIMNNTPLKVEIEKLENIAIIKLAANFHTSNQMADYFRTCLGNLLSEGFTNIIVNMKEVTSIDSEGLGLLALGYKECLKRGGKFIISELHDNDVIEVIEIVNLNKIIPIYSSQNEAISKITTNN